MTLFPIMILVYSVAKIGLTQAQCPAGWSYFQFSCYKVNNMTLDWAGAWGACKTLGTEGDLVKITSQEEANFTQTLDLLGAEAWIGLQQNPGNKSRYLWTDGEEASYTNWNSGEPSNDTESKCVATNGTWKNVQCGESKISICEKVPDWCLASSCNQSCFSTSLRATCYCQDEFVSISNGTSCLALESALTTNRSWEETCSSSQPCTCSSGFTATVTGGVSTCTDINECASSYGGCEDECFNTAGSYGCRCRKGRVLEDNRKNCTDLLSLLTDNKPWEKACNFSSGNCTCSSGYEARRNGDLWTCTDIDECITNTSQCQDVCVNNAGSYQCKCNTGRVLGGDGKNCTDLESFLTENKPWEEKCNDTTHCTSCLSGYEPKQNGDVWTCIDINECDTNTSQCEDKCVNTAGSYKCNCKTGRVLSANGRNCTDLEFFLTENKPWEEKCNDTTNCTNCPSGYEPKQNGDIWTCIDIDECITNTSQCQDICVNKAGGFQCKCYTGRVLGGDEKNCTDLEHYLTEGKPWEMKCNDVTNCTLCPSGYERKQNGDVWTCIDIDECKDNKTHSCQELCINTAGSFRCACPDGYTSLDNATRCILLRTTLTQRLWEEPCVNETSGDCICSEGYLNKTLGNVKTCSDMDECQTNNGGCDQTCVNTPGSYHCLCQKGYHTEDEGRTCRESTDVLLIIVGAGIGLVTLAMVFAVYVMCIVKKI